MTVKGNLKNQKLSYQFLPNELAHGNWFIRIQSLAYSLNGQGIKDICVTRCNLVTSLTFSEETNQVTNYEQPIGMFMFDPKIKRKTVNFDVNWLFINVYSDELIISVSSEDQNKNLTIDCDIYCIVQLYKES